jgi:hypothetical protein
MSRVCVTHTHTSRTLVTHTHTHTHTHLIHTQTNTTTSLSLSLSLSTGGGRRDIAFWSLGGFFTTDFTTDFYYWIYCTHRSDSRQRNRWAWTRLISKWKSWAFLLWESVASSPLSPGNTCEYILAIPTHAHAHTRITNIAVGVSGVLAAFAW